jgi:hypothetical protein
MASSKPTSPTVAKGTNLAGITKPPAKAAAVPVKVTAAKPAAPAAPKPIAPASARPTAPHSAVATQPAAVTRIPAAPHPTAVPRAPKLGAAITSRPSATNQPATPKPPPPPARISVPVAAPASAPVSAPAAAAPATAPSPKLGPPTARPTADPAQVAAAPVTPAAKSTTTPAAAPVTPSAKPDRPAATTTPAAAPQVNFKLPGAVYSPQLLESVIYDIQYYIDWIRQNQIRQQVGAKPKDEPNHSDETVLVIESWLAGKPATLDTIEALLQHLRSLKLPEIHIMLAALPNRSQRLTLVDWFRNNAGDDLLVSFVADRNLGGGIVVRTPNRVFDFSWKQELIAGRAKLAEILKRV